MPTLQLHGTPQVRLDDGRLLALSLREAVLLAWLHLEGRTPRARLATLLWPEGSDAQARANLRQTLARLRRSAGGLLHEDDSGLALDSATVAVVPADGRPLLGALEVDDAQALSQWLLAQRTAQQRERQRQALQALRQLLDGGRFDEALAASDELLAADAESEEAWRLRMELFYLRGDRAAAVAAWDDCRHALRQAFGVVPSPATQALGQLILSSTAGPVTSTQAAQAQTLPPALRRPPQLIGRDTLLADVERCLALGHAVVLAGVGGLGKSRLLQELLARHEGALLVAARPGDALGTGVLLGRVLSQALARWQPVLDEDTQADLEHLLPGRDRAPALNSALDQHRVLSAARRALRACHGLGLRWLLLDDLQQADEASVEALQVLCGHWLHGAQGTLPVIGLRPDELGAAGRALVDQLADSGRSARFDLQPLPAGDLLALLQTLPLAEPADDGWRQALAAALLTQVGGNPAHVLESLKSLWLDGMATWQPGQPLPVPATLVDSVRRRLQRLGDEALQLAQLAAVAGADFTLALAATALNRAPLLLSPLLARLEAAQVFQGHGFAHDLVAEAVRDSIPAALAAALHALVAEHLAARPGHDEAAGRIAHHLQQSGDARAAAPWHALAGRRARAAWQMAAAAQAFEAAARAIDSRERGAIAEAWLDAARCWLQVRRNDDAARALAAAEALADEPCAQARLLPARTAWLFNTRRRAEAVASAEALIDVLVHKPGWIAADDLGWGLRTVALTVPFGTDIERALVAAGRVQALADPHDEHAQRQVLAARGTVLHWASRPMEAARVLQAAWPAGQSAREAGNRSTLANQLMRVQHALGDLPEAIRLGRLLLAEAPPLELGAVVVSDAMHVLSLMEIASGDAVTGIARWPVLLQLLADAAVPVPDLYVTSQALACMAIGRLDEAAALLAAHPQPADHTLGVQDLNWQLARARLAALRGESPARWLAPVRPALGLAPGLELQRRVAIASIDPPPLAELRPLLADLQARGLRGLLRTLHAAAARAALAAGDSDEAVAQARSALALAAQVDAWIDDAASVWLVAAQVLQACGRHAEAADAAAAGAAWVHAGAAAWPLEHERRAWLQGQPVHRRLLAWSADVSG